MPSESGISQLSIEEVVNRGGMHGPIAAAGQSAARKRFGKALPPFARLLATDLAELMPTFARLLARPSPNKMGMSMMADLLTPSPITVAGLMP